MGKFLFDKDDRIFSAAVPNIFEVQLTPVVSVKLRSNARGTCSLFSAIFACFACEMRASSYGMSIVSFGFYCLRIFASLDLLDAFAWPNNYSPPPNTLTDAVAQSVATQGSAIAFSSSMDCAQQAIADPGSAQSMPTGVSPVAPLVRNASPIGSALAATGFETPHDTSEFDESKRYEESGRVRLYRYSCYCDMPCLAETLPLRGAHRG